MLARARRRPKRDTPLCLDVVHTVAQLRREADGALPRLDVLEISPVAGTENPGAATLKGSINLRLEAGTRILIDEATAILGKTRTEFMVDSARCLAIDVLLDRRLFVLDPARYDAFIRALDDPPAPGPKLRALLGRAPAWKA